MYCLNKNITKIEKVDFWRRKVLPELSGNDIIRYTVSNIKNKPCRL
nr:MAG TPA: hypothetical protein [Caudoviricetes sp.]